jgi:hypothetical protein
MGMKISDKCFHRETHVEYLRTHQKNVDAEFGKRNWLQRPPLLEGIEAIERGSAYTEWSTSPKSGVLVLCGNNSIRRASHCWVSPVAHRLITRMTATTNESSGNASLCIFYLLGLRGEEDTCTHVLKTIIFQLLGMNREVLRKEDYYASLYTHLESMEQLSSETEEHRRERQEILKSAAVKVLDMLDPGTTIWIILDRVDKCRLPPRKRSTTFMDGITLLKTMVYWAEASRARLKVLAVVNRADWPVDMAKHELGISQEGTTVVQRLDQEVQRAEGEC